METVFSSVNRYATHGTNLIQEGLAELGRLLRSRQAIMTVPMILADGLAALTAFNAGDFIYGFLFPGSTGSLANNPGLAAIALMLPISHYLLEVYRVNGQAPIERFLLRIKSTCLFFVLLTSWHYAAGTGPQPVIAIVPTFILVLILPLIGETVVRNLLIRLNLWGTPTVVIGAGTIGQRVIRVLKQTPELGLRPVGVFEDGQEGGTRAGDITGVPILGSIADSLAYNQRIDTAIVTTPSAQQRIDDIAASLGYRNLIVVPDLRELPTLGCARATSTA